MFSNILFMYKEVYVLYAELKRYEDAEEIFKKALEFNPPDARAYNNLAWMYYLI